LRNRRLVEAILAASAAAGLVGAHALAYVVALPDPAVRSLVLRATGHAYFSAAVVVAVVAAIFGCAAAAALGVRNDNARLTLRSAAWRVVGAQATAFALLEVAERAAVNVAPLSIGARLAIIGLVVQAVVGFAAAAIVVAVCRVARAARRALTGRRAWPARRWAAVVASFDSRPLERAFANGLGARAPPATPR
jgi:hypothetical protein